MFIGLFVMAGVVQLDRAPDCGSGSRRFKSDHSPHTFVKYIDGENLMSVFKYDEIVQRALISVVQEVLTQAEKEGLPGNHHFYVRFRTDHPRTHIPKFLKERHPEEIMIVLQHQFWNLKVSNDGFSVELSFNGMREELKVPFSSLTAFVDPSVKFALQFTPSFDDSGDTTGFRQTTSIQSSDSQSPEDGKIISFDSFKKK